MTEVVSQETELRYDVSVIVAIRNEESHIEKCLDCLLSQNVPRGTYEIIVVDGLSTDNTRQIIERYAAEYPNLVKVYANPKKNQASGRNIGIRNSRGRFIQITDGHTYLKSDYLQNLLEYIDKSSGDFAGIGGIHLPSKDEGFVGKVMAHVQMSLLGGAGTSFRSPKASKEVDTVVFPVYKKSVLDKVGLYDERFVVAEDVELNYRIRKAGFRLLVNPKAIAYYKRRHSSLYLFWKRMIKYGVWRAMVLKKHPRSLKPLFLIPVLLSLAPVAYAIFGMTYTPLAQLTLYILLAYSFATVANSAWLSMRNRDPRFMVAVLFYFAEHFGIGIGMIAGLLNKSPISSKDIV